MTNLAERVKGSKREKGTFILDGEPFGRLVVSPQGLEIIESAPEKTESILSGLKARWDILRVFAGQIRSNPKIAEQLYEELPNYLKGNSLHPDVDWNPHKFLGRGSEGSAYRFKYPNQNFVLKFFDSYDSNRHLAGGIDQFNALSNVPANTVYRTPTPYFATQFLTSAEDLSIYPDFFRFVLQNPREEKRLLKYIKNLCGADPIISDIGDILPHYDEQTLNWEATGLDRDEVNSAVYVVGFNPDKKSARDRYKLGAVDIALKE